MSKVFIKNRGKFVEAWIEAWDNSKMDWTVVCEAQLLLAGNNCLIDTIDTKVKFRRKGYATKLVKELQTRFETVSPIGITASSRGFWDKLNMSDALGEEI